MLSPSQIIVLATPVFFALIVVEWLISLKRGRNAYALADAVSSLNLGVLSQTSAVFTKLLTLGIYTFVASHIALVQADHFWLSLPGWILALIFYDFCYYWLHRMGHEVNVLWAAHVVHHQSQAYNLSTALRQTSSGALLGWVFYLPMALAGVPPLVFAVVGLIDLLYQFWVHTEQVKKLGWFDRWFCSPSNHRVHHAVNEQYLDKNYGGILIIWDRIFGTFKEEDDKEPCVYGTRGLLNSWDPLWANATVYRQLAHDSWFARNGLDKIKVWFKPPGWRPLDVAQRFPKPEFNLDEHRILYAPPMNTPLRWFVSLQFAALIAGTTVFLWNADQSPLATNLMWFGVLLTAQWALSAAMQGRISVWMALMLQSGALAMATAALGLQQWHWFFKPLSMIFALVCIATSHLNAMGTEKKLSTKQVSLLLAAIVFSLSGDVCLMLANLFIPGLISFLLAHVCYIALFKTDAPWFANRRALWLIVAIGAGMYAYLWMNGLPSAIRLPVAVYVSVIALMAAQAWGRYQVLRERSSLLVALGASAFMVSDSFLAINRFVQPLPWSAIWVLASYYIAQALIVQGSLRGQAQSRTTPDLAVPPAIFPATQIT
ncbi:sterol desaturase family protein [Comamonas sp. Y33R10-2]|uniref:lysoplasmalogenase family protein n=1 Tax=Comamonas sp. Y33R10-2 TaxID=2853257 RepID=UPI001C5C919B|nr:lysoplasmalogenase family protein [Comamonas sp. Y33R10-2]QXZ09252.1 sterol desaturase family protein [Comamonas sp. Y33R10-2]